MTSHHSHPPGVHAPGVHAAGIAELLDLDADVLRAYLHDVTGWVWQQASDRPRPRIVDLGAGTGTGTVALAERFTRSDVYAVDMSDEMLTRVRDRAQLFGVTDRVRTVRADLNSVWPDVGSVDLVWAASSLHELSHPERVLSSAYDALTPGGVFVAVEMDAAPRFLPDDVGLGSPGLESRIHAVLDALPAVWEPHPDWGPRLEAAGFTLLEKRTFVTDVLPPLPPAAGRYARVYLGRVRDALVDELAGADLHALAILLADDDPRALVRRDDLRIRGTRTAWLARRP